VHLLSEFLVADDQSMVMDGRLKLINLGIREMKMLAGSSFLTGFSSNKAFSCQDLQWPL
jgi:hypothetical protein